MRRAALAAILALLLVLSASPVTAHGNHVEADSQRSDDGTVVVEAVRPLSDGFLVLHRGTADGEFGDPIGHVPIAVADGFQQDVHVQVDDEAWAEWPDDDTVWVVFHADADDDGEFTPGTDPATSAFGTVTGRPITLAKSGTPARVLGERSEPQRTDAAKATVSEVVLPEDGFLVLRHEDADGQVVATRALSEGEHADVTLSLDESALPDDQSTVGLYAELYTDDGDGEFTTDDERVSAGDQVVSTYFLVWRVDDANATTTERIVNTAATDEDVVTPTPNESTRTTDGTDDETESLVPGFGILHATVAALVATIVLVRRE
jgi:ketosteroid isomerase-like protein